LSMCNAFDETRVYTALPLMGYHEGQWHRLTSVDGIRPSDNPYEQSESPPGQERGCG
jgi:hypothetical protein